ncbi:MAG: hypothetical protein ABI867_26160, partial [Kofleriaceae bacterium]
MDAELKHRVEALRRPLELAAANGFAGVRKVQGLGHALRAGCDGLIGRVEVEGLQAWRVTLAGWEKLDEYQQAIEVARGMRLIARMPRPQAPVIETGKPVLSPIAAKSVEPGPAAAKARKPKPTSESTETPSRAKPNNSDPADATPSRAKPNDSNTAEETLAAKPSRANADETPAAKASRAKPNDSDPAEETPAAKRTKRPVVVAEPPGDPLAAPTHTLPGIGPAFAVRLAEKGLATVEHLLWTLPRRYDDVRNAQTLAEVCALPEGQRATFVARVASSRMIFARGRRWAEVRFIEDKSGEGRTRSSAGGDAKSIDKAIAVIRWFNVWSGIEKRMPPGAVVALSGVVRRRSNVTELANPDILGIELADGDKSGEGQTRSSAEGDAKSIDKSGEGRARSSAEGDAKSIDKKPPAILARYPDIAGVPASRLRQACHAACERVGHTADDGVPATVERAAGLPTLAETLVRLHSPSPDISIEDLAAMNEGRSRWQRRLAFGELFALGVAVALRRRERCSDAAVPCPAAPGLAAAIRAALPFTPTKAQARSIDEIGADLARAVPMNRLLQGDVGSGKTAVAFA